MTSSTVSHPTLSVESSPYSRRYARAASLLQGPEEVFAFFDDYRNLARHMQGRSWRTAWMKMTVESDRYEGRAIGSHITMRTGMLGVNLSLDEVVVSRVPPTEKSWRTFEEPSLVVIGDYHITVTTRAEGAGTRLRVAIEYAPPRRHRWLGRVFGPVYAKWCVNTLIGEARGRLSPIAT